MGLRFIKIASVYFVIGVILGMVMGIAESFQYTSTHAHVNLLGWVSMALFGMIYHVFPQIGSTRLAKLHFWLHNIGLPVMILGLIFFALGNLSIGIPVMSIGGTIVIAATIIFAINVLTAMNKSKSVKA